MKFLACYLARECSVTCSISSPFCNCK